MTRLLLEMIRDRPRPARKPKKWTRPEAWKCPVNGADCGLKCFVRHVCHRDPDGVRELLVRLDRQTAEAIGEFLAKA